MFTTVLGGFILTIGIISAWSKIIFEEPVPIIKQKKVLPKQEKYKNLSQAAKETDTCIICLESFQADDLITQLPCSIRHIYHVKCFACWLK